MIIQQSCNMQTNMAQTSQFTIQASAKAFHILSDKLYSDKIGAVVRELSCNARDSHTEAGNPNPFHLNVPSQINPIFSVEDWGVGMSEEQIQTLYTSYFSSSKGQTNDLIGGLGLGSKTPFAYTNSFTIRSRKDGVELHFIAYIGDDGTPCLSKAYESSTDQPNGVRVEVPVRKDDAWAFQQAVSKQLSFFKQKPITNKEIEWAEITRLPTGIVYSPGFYDNAVLMAGVRYNIPREMWISLISKNDVQLARATINNRPLAIEFDIGDISILPSREGIEDTKQNMEAIHARLVEMNNSITADIDKAARMSLRDGFEYILKTYDSYATTNKWCNAVSKKWKVNGDQDAVHFIADTTKKTGTRLDLHIQNVCHVLNRNRDAKRFGIISKQLRTSTLHQRIRNANPGCIVFTLTEEVLAKFTPGMLKLLLGDSKPKTVKEWTQEYPAVSAGTERAKKHKEDTIVAPIGEPHVKLDLSRFDKETTVVFIGAALCEHYKQAQYQLPSYITSLNIPAQYKSRVEAAGLYIAESFNDASEHFREMFIRKFLAGRASKESAYDALRQHFCPLVRDYIYNNHYSYYNDFDCLGSKSFVGLLLGYIDFTVDELEDFSYNADTLEERIALPQPVVVEMFEKFKIDDKIVELLDKMPLARCFAAYLCTNKEYWTDLELFVKTCLGGTK